VVCQGKCNFQWVVVHKKINRKGEGEGRRRREGEGKERREEEKEKEKEKQQQHGGSRLQSQTLRRQRLGGSV
jgi:hypothetical protein